MKKISSIFLLGILLSAFSFTSCDKIEDAVEVTINTEFEAPLVAVPEGKSATFNVSEVLDPRDSKDLKDYLDKIKSIEITNIKIEVVSVAPADIELENAVFSVTDNVTGKKFEYSTPANTKLTEGLIFEVGKDHPDWAIINGIINDLHASTVTAVGSVNNEEFVIEFKLIISVKAVANGLK
ncbi:MAG: hypothetical protein KAH25_05340 [Bacteroidales bacterium]|nr:hypothetical protein [Bacteroidales bacterium]